MLTIDTKDKPSAILCARLIPAAEMGGLNGQAKVIRFERYKFLEIFRVLIGSGLREIAVCFRLGEGDSGVVALDVEVADEAAGEG